MSPDVIERFVGLAACGVCAWRESREAGTEDVALRLATDSLIQHQSEDGHSNEGSRVSSRKAETIH
jgi:hypothetical protein